MKPEDDWGREILLYLQRIFADHANGSETCEMTTKAYLYLIFARMFEHMRPAAVKGTVPTGSHDKVERLKSVLGYIHKRYPEQLKLKELADEANMSEGHFCRFSSRWYRKVLSTILTITVCSRPVTSSRTRITKSWILPWMLALNI